MKDKKYILLRKNLHTGVISGYVGKPIYGWRSNYAFFFKNLEYIESELKYITKTPGYEYFISCLGRVKCPVVEESLNGEYDPYKRLLKFIKK